MNLIVKNISYQDTYPWLKHKHYAKRIPSISFAFGLFKEKKLVGICTYGKPPSNALCIGICGEEKSSIVYELNRLCVNEGLKKNSLSFFVAKTFKLLPKPLILVSYADTSQNHHGYIYQATNWIYTGLSAKRTERYDPNNPNKHSKTVTETMKYEDTEKRDRPQKHRYIMFLGNKTEKRELGSLLKYKKDIYPKGINKRYDASFNPETQGQLF